MIYQSLLVIGVLLSGLATVSPVANQEQVVSGHFNLYFSNFLGRSNYSIYYEFPKVVNTDSSFRIRTTLFVNELSGFKLYISNYGMIITLYAKDRAFVRNITPNETRFLYEGAHWGPIETTFLLNSRNLGSQDPTNVSISIRFVATVWYELPPNCDLCKPYELEGSEENVGNITILPQQTYTATSYIYLVALVAIVATISAILIAVRHSVRNRH